MNFMKEKDCSYLVEGSVVVAWSRLGRLLEVQTNWGDVDTGTDKTEGCYSGVQLEQGS